jgi:hypothetical protein
MFFDRIGRSAAFQLREEKEVYVQSKGARPALEKRKARESKRITDRPY